ncbi:MAG: hypothetical protein KBD37_06140 [Burkholderiales bacterium]|nr:hypothetical protein [Burkholderiales bacterium]
MSNAENTTLKNFIKIEENTKTEVLKNKMVRLNFDIEKAKLNKFKIVALKNNLTMKQILTNYIDSVISNE